MEQSELKEILEQHRLWIKTNKAQGTRANLYRANLQGAYLWCANLSGANLSGANLRDADLRDADLGDADLGDADLRGANLEGANLRGAGGANLHGANLECANLECANLECASLECAILTGAKLRGANLNRVDLKNTIGLPDISWIIPSCLVQLNRINYGFYLVKERKHDNFIQDSFGFIIQNNAIEKTFDMLVEDRIIRGIPDWVKYSGLKQAATESV